MCTQTLVCSTVFALLLSISTNIYADSHEIQLKELANPVPLESPEIRKTRVFSADKAQPAPALAIHPLIDVVEPVREEPRPTWDRKTVTPFDNLVMDDFLWKFPSIPSLRIPVLRAPYPTFGVVMPLPAWWSTTERFYPIDVNSLEFHLTGVKNYVLTAAIERYKHIITSRVGLSAYSFRWAHQQSQLIKLAQAHLHDSTVSNAGRTGTSGTTVELSEQPSAVWSLSRAERFRQRYAPRATTMAGLSTLENVLVQVRSPGADWPSLDMDESYSLLVDRHGILLVANQTWGALRGLESLSQLMWRTSDGSQVYINQTLIQDKPRFAHRGVLVDTSRHYISKSIMLLNLEAMAYNKLNVLHWHIVDDSSYPFQSSVFPELSKKGAFFSRQIYTAVDIREIVEFARMRGIRVIPEFDVPGHSRSLAYSKPELLAQCQVEEDPTIYFGPLNTFSNETFAFLRKLLEEVVELFPDEYIHLGGDEVEPECWEIDAEMEKMRRRLGATAFQAHEYFWTRLQNIVTDIGVRKPGKHRKIIVWQEVLQHVSEVLDSLVMQIWKPDSAMDIPHTERIIYSSCWYLDQLFNVRNWGTYYLCDPETKLGPLPAARRSILGGEASMWTEYQSDDSILQKIWPVTSGIAERLWSPYYVDNLQKVGPRIEEQRCRMISRGIPQGVLLGPGSCDPPGVVSTMLNIADPSDAQSQFSLLDENILYRNQPSISLRSCLFYVLIGFVVGSVFMLILTLYSVPLKLKLHTAWPRRFSLLRLLCFAVILITVAFFLSIYIV